VYCGLVQALVLVALFCCALEYRLRWVGRTRGSGPAAVALAAKISDPGCGSGSEFGVVVLLPSGRSPRRKVRSSRRRWSTGATFRTGFVRREVMERSQSELCHKRITSQVQFSHRAPLRLRRQDACRVGDEMEGDEEGI